MGLIVKTWERCKRTVDEGRRVRRRRVAPEGCFTVRVGPERERFAVKTEYANHALFKALLDEAESEYGYPTLGPISLPCNVDVFCRVMLQMDYHPAEMHPLNLFF